MSRISWLGQEPPSIAAQAILRELPPCYSGDLYDCDTEFELAIKEKRENRIVACKNYWQLYLKNRQAYQEAIDWLEYCPAPTPAVATTSSLGIGVALGLALGLFIALVA